MLLSIRIGDARALRAPNNPDSNAINILTYNFYTDEMRHILVDLTIKAYVVMLHM